MTETTEGTVKTINVWPSGKGYFLRLSGNEADFYAFGSARCEAGDYVKLDVEKGTGNFSEKNLIKKCEKAEESEGFEPVATMPRTDKDNSINRSVALKCASWLIAATMAKEKDATIDTLGDLTIELAKKLTPFLENNKRA